MSCATIPKGEQVTSNYCPPTILDSPSPQHVLGPQLPIIYTLPTSYTLLALPKIHCFTLFQHQFYATSHLIILIIYQQSNSNKISAWPEDDIELFK